MNTHTAGTLGINDVKCPACKAAPGNGCSTPSGNPSNEPHAARVNKMWREIAKTESKGA